MDSIFGIDISCDGKADFLDDAIIMELMEEEEREKQARMEAEEDEYLWSEDDDQ